ncbi:Zn-dependent alcohol dehydrogenase [Microbacterium sp. UBA3394]|uniref:Zn-dependent alcohol dehydrogenase n=1 Tax=Microbacterium sp. UBA3394 TaxID=1946945 RepID=UPI000C482D21|nr:Zn-dependent alcohol dehydrogenase [Microbacterium sp. UBA3394]MAM53342.1 alcohol dehydrogenase [Microbacterium sp.]|tara:strand:- start:23522 stop:24613 length:1092 start_codon:yes stop_codon:yes gene_type:complete
MTTVKAAVYSGSERLDIREVELREPGRGEVRVRIGASGVCGSDRHVLDGDWEMPTPTIMGHEGAGVVEAVGDGVTSLEVGDHVIMTWFYPCGTCSSCRQGRTWVCTGSRSEECLLPDGSTPTSIDDDTVFPYLAVGSMSERVIVAEQAAVRVPKEVPFDVAALIGCSIATGVGAVVNDARVQPGRSALVIGAGGVGLSIIMGLALAGASPIIAADVTDEALDLAKQFGATHTVRSGGDLADRVREIVPDGADFAFEAIGRPETIALMPSTVQRGGTAVIVGLPPQDRPAPIDALALAEEGKALLGSNYGGTVPARDFPMLARLYLDGRLPVDKLITNRFALDDVNEAFDLMRAGAKGRSVLVM